MVVRRGVGLFGCRPLNLVDIVALVKARCGWRRGRGGHQVGADVLTRTSGPRYAALPGTALRCAPRAWIRHGGRLGNSDAVGAKLRIRLLMAPSRPAMMEPTRYRAGPDNHPQYREGTTSACARALVSQCQLNSGAEACSGHLSILRASIGSRCAALRAG